MAKKISQQIHGTPTHRCELCKSIRIEEGFVITETFIRGEEEIQVKIFLQKDNAVWVADALLSDIYIWGLDIDSEKAIEDLIGKIELRKGMKHVPNNSKE